MVVDKNNIKDALSFLSTQNKLAVDTETEGLRKHHKTFSCQIATKEREYYFDKRILGEDYYQLAEILNKPRTYYLQNAKYDLKMLRKDNITPSGDLHDLEILTRLWKNDVMSTRLKDTAKMFGMEKLDVVDKYVKENKLWTRRQSPYWRTAIYEDYHFDKVPLDIMQEYACHDARITYDLCELSLQRVPDSSKKVLATEQRLISICQKMEERGVLVDRDKTLRFLEQESGLILEAKSHFHMATGFKYDGSKTQLLEVFTRAGENIPKTDKGNPSLNVDALDSFTSPVAKIVKDIRRFEKRIATYYATFLDLMDDEHYIHPDMRQAGTTTGRFSYRDPNFQQLPSEEDDSDMDRDNLVRSCLVPPEGYNIVACDYKAQELRIMYAYANEKNLIEAVMRGHDAHQATADLVGITRRQAKTLNFSLSYGAGPDKIAEALDISVENARLLMQKFFRGVPRVDNFLQRVKNEVKSRGYVTNFYGRRLNLPMRDSSFSYKIPNHLIQSTGGDICKLAMVGIDDKFGSSDEVLMFMQLHDALYFYVRKDCMHHVPRIKEIMKSVWPRTNGMNMDVDVMWSELSMAKRDMVKYENL